MLNNRQNGRRRGRGGGPGRPQGNQPGQGNRQDNRSRGNASQLLEKYRTLARDAQMQGDRVQAEHYLQFADHYFRVLNENRSRFEEQRPRRDDYADDEDQEEGLDADNEGEGESRFEPRREERAFRQDRPDRHDRADRQDRGERQDRPDRQDRGERQERAGAGEEGGNAFVADRNGQRFDEGRRPRRVRANDEDGGDERIALDVLPPAIAPEGDEAAPAPRRRGRRPRTEGGEEIAPAA